MAQKPQVNGTAGAGAHLASDRVEQVQPFGGFRRQLRGLPSQKLSRTFQLAGQHRGVPGLNGGEEVTCHPG